MRIAIALGCMLLGVLILGLGFSYRLPAWGVVALYLLIYALLGLLPKFKRKNPPGDAEPAPDYSHIPTSGPIGRLGQTGLKVMFLGSQFLVLLNPFQMVQLVRQGLGNLRLQARERNTGDDGRRYRSKARYRLPFNGEWLLYNGGMTPATSHSWDVLGQRFALDFVVCDEQFRRHEGRGTHVTEYFAYGQDIVSAAAGEVMDVEDRIGDAPWVGWGVCDFTARSFIGNYVLIRHADDEYGLYAHLIRGSIRVRPGDRVISGQVIGQCGHSGHSSEPHLHFHLQNSADLFNGMGLPITFENLEIDGQSHERAQITAGQRVRFSGP